jgi:hypothetical protein
VAKGYSQVEGLDFEKTFALVACLKTIHILLEIAFPMELISCPNSFKINRDRQNK